MTLWHYTCRHSHEQLTAETDSVHGLEGAWLLPAVQLVKPERRHELTWAGTVVWLTDLAQPMRPALGLTTVHQSCDRTAYRYRVLDEARVMPWWSAARLLSREYREQLEAAPGARPRHWFVSSSPVPVVYDPEPQRVLLDQALALVDTDHSAHQLQRGEDSP